MYSLSTISSESRALKLTLPFAKLSDFIMSQLMGYVTRQIQNLELKVAGLVALFEEEPTLIVKEEMDKIDSLLSVIRAYDSIVPPKYWELKKAMASICQRMEKFKELALRADDLSETEYLLGRAPNKKHLLDSMDSKSVDLSSEFA